MAKPNELLLENQELKDRVGYLEAHIMNLEGQLQKIHRAKTFRIWQYVANSRRHSYIKLLTKLYNVIEQIKSLLPIWVRKRIKAKLQIAIASKQGIIDLPKEIANEWQNWYQNRPDDSMDIIIFGITDFDYRMQRPQHLALELVKKGHRVFYIETEFITYRDKEALYAPIKVRRHVVDNLYIVNLSAAQNYFIYRDVPNPKDVSIIISSLKTLLKAATIINPVAKIDHPFWGCIIENIAMPSIHDCMDEHSGFKDSGSGLASNEVKLVRKSDLTLVSSDYLKKKINQLKPRQLLTLRNAGEYEHFEEKNLQQMTIPHELEHIPKPIVGYYGAISEWFDTEILETLARDHKKVSFVLIGRVNNSQVTKLASKYKNIYLIGEKPYVTLPQYVAHFSVCLIPFIVNDLIKATNPVKIYEYFATGKPVVATALPELMYFKDVIAIASTRQDFSHAVEKALTENDRKLMQKRQKIARENTWATRGKVLDETIRQLFFPKVSVIVLSYFKPDLIKACLESVLNRSMYPNLEVVVVDNASSQETIDVLKSYNKLVNVKLIFNKRNVGFGAGNNIGLKAASGEYLILLNNDTIVTPGWISRLLFHIRKPYIGLVGPVTNNLGNEQKVSVSYDDKIPSDIAAGASEYTYQHWGETLSMRSIAAFCWILSRSLYNKLGGFDVRYGKALFEDDDYCMQVKRADLQILCADDVFVHHIGGASTNWQSPEFKELLAENRKKFEEKWQTKWIPHKYRNQ